MPVEESHNIRLRSKIDLEKAEGETKVRQTSLSSSLSSSSGISSSPDSTGVDKAAALDERPRRSFLSLISRSLDSAAF